MDKTPAAAVHEFSSGGAVNKAALRLNHADKLDFSGGEQVHGGVGSVGNNSLALERVNVESLESDEVLEEGFVRASHGKLHLGSLRQHGEVFLAVVEQFSRGAHFS